MKYKPYQKVVDTNIGICAIYEPHPYRNTSASSDTFVWVFYDGYGNPVGISEEKPKGIDVDAFTNRNVGSQDVANYLNSTPFPPYV